METVPLVKYVDRRLDAEGKLRVALEKHVKSEVNGIREAVRVAKKETDGRLGRMNEFRSQLDKQAATFATHDDLDPIKDSLKGFVTRAEMLTVAGIAAAIAGAIATGVSTFISWIKP